MPKKDRQVSKKHPLISGIMLPSWDGNLDFRHAKREEAAHLKMLYEAAWGAGITISTDQIKAKIRNFPDGQIVGVEKGKDEPVSMINIMLMLFSPEKGFVSGYEEVTGGRTFSTSISPLRLYGALEKSDGNALGIASCVSVATNPKFFRSGYAYETLNYAIMFSSVNDLIPAPYSAPRGFARARMKNPDLEMYDYLHMTKPSRISWESHFAKLGAISPRLNPAFNGETIFDINLFTKYQQIGKDDLNCSFYKTAFWKFLLTDAKKLEEKYGRTMTIEDFCILSGRVLLDPVIGMHVSNGARFIRNEQGHITAVFPGSRPEDPTALGFNIVLAYGFHPLLGHKYDLD
jgi:hypothetical protein